MNLRICFATVLFVGLLSAEVGGTSMKIDFLHFAHVRTDPIINQTALSDHVHTFYGATAIRPETTYEDLRDAYGNSGNVLENKSLYWHPAVYKVGPNGVKTLAEVYYASAYYIWITGETTAFPDGFKMIIYEPENPEEEFFPMEPEEELERSITFPDCWDPNQGIVGAPPNFNSHVEFSLPPTGEQDLGDCPPSHQVRLPQIQFFVRLRNYEGGGPGSYVFSDGSTRLHADYFSGWKQAELQNILDTCMNDSFDSLPDAFCEGPATFIDGPKAFEECETLDGFKAKLEAFQPLPYDTSTITTEHIDNVENLPRGTGTGTLIPAVPGADVTLPAWPTFPPSVRVTPSTCDDDGDGGDGEGGNDDEVGDDGMGDDDGDGDDGVGDDGMGDDDDDGGDDGEGDGSSCFSGTAQVYVENVGPTMLRDLKLGDNVLVEHDLYEPVYTFGHLDLSTLGAFLRLVTDDAVTPLELSHKHMLPVQNKGIVPASLVRVGDYITNHAGDAVQVVSVESIVAQGLVAPFTPSGKLVVNGFVASCYIALQEAEHIHVGSWESPLTFQWMAHSYNFPHRFYCQHLSDCTAERYAENGLSLWVADGYDVAKWLLNQHYFVFGMVLTLSMPLVCTFTVIESLSLTLLAVAGCVIAARGCWRKHRHGSKDVVL